MSSKASGWAVFGVIAVTGVVIASCAIASSSASPRKFIGKNYSCDVDPTEHDTASCDDSDSPANVATAIAADTQPVDTQRPADNVSSVQCDDTTTADSEYGPDADLCADADLPRDDQTVYMQYEDDLVVVSKADTGCTVDVYDYDEGYRRHGAFFAVVGWTSTRPSSRGGGFSGFGK